MITEKERKQLIKKSITEDIQRIQYKQEKLERPIQGKPIPGEPGSLEKNINKKYESLLEGKVNDYTEFAYKYGYIEGWYTKCVCKVSSRVRKKNLEQNKQ